MTVPTPAQIEAAANKMSEYASYPYKDWMAIAKAALTAAAHVGEPDRDWIEKRKAIHQSAIERCAQVAEQHWIPGPFNTIPQDIAAAIRKLKDET